MLATDKQLRFITTLGKEISLLPNRTPEHEAKLERIRANWKKIPQDAGMASSVIGSLLDIKTELAGTDRKAAEGMHRLDGHIYKVQVAVHGSGNLYAKKLVRGEDDTWSFEYESGAIRRLSDATLMSLEDAKEFGALYGVCCVCGRILTNEASIADGIGPICAGKF